jgi:cytochrome P450
LVPVTALQHFLTADDRIYKYGEDAFQDYLDRYGRTVQRKDILTKLIRRAPGEKEGLTDAQISSEISNLTFAATDTTALVLTYLFWELAQQPDLQALLREELKDVPMKTGAGVPEHRDIVNLPLLNAVIQETMRKHPPVPMGLLRETPGEGKTIEGYFIPQKVSFLQPFKYDS